MADGKKKADICDYIDWRGDLTFACAPLNEVDALIFCQLSYLNFSGIVPHSLDTLCTLSELSARYFASGDFAARSDLGMLIDPKSNELLQKAAGSERFKHVAVTGFVSEYNQEKEEQFSAVTFVLPAASAASAKQVFVAFRGTDDTIVGWKEDFNLAFMERVPAQVDALSYLENAAVHFSDAALFAGGHSKGGNLALYASAHLNESARQRLLQVYNFDGPGFLQESLDSAAFCSIKPKICSVFPQFSVVGMLFQHYEPCSVVLSDELLLMQHNPFSWFVRGTHFETKSAFDAGSALFFRSFNAWFGSIKPEQREQFVETLFGLLDATDALTNTELSRDITKNTGKILKAFASLDKEIRDEAVKLAGDFIKTVIAEAIKGE